MLRRLIALLRKEFIQVRRDKFSVRLLFVIPIMQTLILGYAMTRDVKNIKLGILDMEHSEQSSSLTRHIYKNKRFVWVENYTSISDVREGLVSGSIVVGVVIPKGFSTKIQSAVPEVSDMVLSDKASISILVDGQDAASAGTSAGYTAAIMNKWSTEYLGKELALQGADISTLQPLILSDRILFNPNLEYSWYMVPGMLILLITMTGALLTSFSLVRERENGTLEQLLVTPVSPIQIIIGKAFPYWVLSQITFYLALGVVGLWYHLPFHMLHFGGLLIGLALYALTSVSLGILVSTVVSSQQQALFLIWFFLIFFILTSGFMLPFESMPMWMQSLTEFNAVRHFLYIVRALLLRGAEPSTLLLEYGKLAGIACTLFFTSIAVFKRKSV